MTTIAHPVRLYYHTDPLLRVSELRTAEISSIKTLPPHTLMTRAGTSVARWLLERLDEVRSSKLSKSESNIIWFAIGPGNNGGDALVAATRLHQLGIQVEACVPIDTRHKDALWALSLARTAGVQISKELPLSLEHYAWVVDGLFGTGLTNPLCGIFAEIATRIAARTKFFGRVLSIDIPSGLNSDTGEIVGGKVSVKATHTLTFIAAKPGLYMNDGRDLAGEIEVMQLDVSIHDSPSIHLASHNLFLNSLPERPFRSNKGTFGSLAVIGGNIGMSGALILTARAALFAGTGKVHIGFVGKNTQQIYDPLFPELMLNSASSLQLDKITAIVIGPGLGKCEEAISIVHNVIETNATILFDADGLNIIAAHPSLIELVALRKIGTCILTPHPLEAARLLGSDKAVTIQYDRITTAQTLAARFKSIVVLKGIGTVIASPDGRLIINPTGNAALATSGTGDILSGIIGALLAQRVPAYEAAIAAVYLHGLAADVLVSKGIGPSGVTSKELTMMVRKLLNQITYFGSFQELSTPV
ncbi:MAG: NAD(P)H-hydrate dehydratase [Burkholderia sp.]|nr:NAD(P)H-hydrate dehydratase [Burkholderia sp.]